MTAHSRGTPAPGDKCPWCNAFLSVTGHIEGCALGLAETISSTSIQAAVVDKGQLFYRLQHLPTGDWYGGGRVSDALGQVYSRKGLLSVLGRRFQWFNVYIDLWECHEYLVQEERIEHLFNGPLCNSQPYQEAEERHDGSSR